MSLSFFQLTCGIGVTVRRPFKCRDGKIALSFAITTTCMSKDEYAKPEGLPNVTNKVKVEVIPKDKKHNPTSATFPVKELVDLLKGRWPNDDNYSTILKAIRSRNNHPMPDAEVPALPNLKTAQGQTKKPGSHSENKHG